MAQRLIALTIPMIGGMLSMVVFNLADTYFVSQLDVGLARARYLPAISFTFPVVMFVGCLALGLGMGTSSVVSRAIGQGDQHKVQELTTYSLVLAVVVVAIVTLLGVIFLDPIFRMLGAQEDSLRLIREYMIIWFPGAVFVVVPMVGNNAIRGAGDTTWPSLVMLLGATVNVILDPLLIYGLWIFPRMELAGAALATVIARMATCIGSLLILHYRKRMLSLTWPGLGTILRSWGETLYVGGPAAVGVLLFPLSVGVVTRFISAYGKDAIGAFGAASRVEGFSMLVLWALGSALMPIVGQNWGAGKPERARKAVHAANGFAIVWGLFCAAVLAVAGWAISGIFSDSAELRTHMQWYLWIMPISFGARGVTILVSRFFNALNHPADAVGIDAVRLFAGYVPLSWLGGQLFGLYGIFGGIAAANILGSIAAAWWEHHRWKALLAKAGPETPPQAAVATGAAVGEPTPLDPDVG